jgi:hypothetical protein
MKVFWKDSALNLMPESEEDGQVTSAILFAYGTRSNLANVVFKVTPSGITDSANQQGVVAVDVPLNISIEGVASNIASHEPLREENSVSTD